MSSASPLASDPPTENPQKPDSNTIATPHETNDRSRMKMETPSTDDSTTPSSTTMAKSDEITTAAKHNANSKNQPTETSTATINLSSSPSSSIQINHHTNRSAYMFALQQIIKFVGRFLLHFPSDHPTGSPRLTAHKSALKKCEVHEKQVAGIYTYELRPRGARKEKRRTEAIDGKVENGQEKTTQQRRKRIYYFAGGGWQSLPSAEHWAFCSDLAQRLGPGSLESSATATSTFILVSYPLAPLCPAPNSFPALMAFYRAVLADAAANDEEVVLVGDSAGGNLVLCLALAALKEDEENAQAQSTPTHEPKPTSEIEIEPGLGGGSTNTPIQNSPSILRPHPSAIIAISPSTDLRRSNPQIHQIAKHDPILSFDFVKQSAEAWRGSWKADDPRVSPLSADVGVLARRDVRVHGVLGGYDLLMPDAVLFRDRCARQGVMGKWLVWEKQMHCFPLMARYRLPEAVEATGWIVDVLKGR